MIVKLHSNWKTLPVEILHPIFQQIPTCQLRTVVHVCKAWMYPAQVLLYSDVFIFDLRSLSKFHNTVKNNSRLGLAVKKLTLYEMIIAVRLFGFESALNSAEVDKCVRSLLFTHLINLESIKMPTQILYKHVFDALMDNKLKYLKNLSIPNYLSQNTDLVQYGMSTLFMKDRLENISITCNHDNILHGFFSCIYKDLHQFRRLKAITINIITKEEIQVFEYITASTQSLKKIKIYAHDSTPSANDSNTITNFIPKPNVKKLAVYGIDGTNLAYIMHKFPCLDKLYLSILNGLDPQAYINNNQLLPQLIRYCWNISGSAKVCGIIADHNIISKSIAAVCDVTHPVGDLVLIYSEKVEKPTLEFSISKSQRRNEFKIAYPFSEWLHTGFIEATGEFINKIEFKFGNDGEHVDDMFALPENFMSHTLTYCPYLESLSLRNCVLTRSARYPCYTFTLKSLTFEDCHIKVEVLEELSEFLLEIEVLYLFGVSNDRIEIPDDDEAGEPPIFELIMPNTKIDKIYVSYFSRRSDTLYIMIVYVTSEEKCYYYKYDGYRSCYSNELSKSEYMRKYYANEYFYFCCKTKPVIFK